jgi:hypothetical protein
MMTVPAEADDRIQSPPNQVPSGPNSNANSSRRTPIETIGHAVRTQSFRAARKYLPDGLVLRLLHFRNVGKFPHLRHPRTFNEIILHRCLFPDPRWTNLTDKLLVREYVKARIGEEHLIPLIATPDAFTETVFDSLPNEFVMKANHGCGFVKIVRNKAKTSFAELSRLADEWLHTDFFRFTRERHYKAIEPRIYFETLLKDDHGRVPADLKLNMFGQGPDGAIIYTGVVTDRFGEPRHDFYDPDWRRLEVELGHYPCSTQSEPPPPNWDAIVDIATRLADGLGYVRVDLYSTGGKVYFGELTFTPGGGLMRITPERYDMEWGELIRQMQ